MLAGISENRVHVSTLPLLERANDTTCVKVIDNDGNLSAPRERRLLPAVVAGDTEY